MNSSLPDDEVIFHAARAIPDANRRRAYVQEACAGSETLQEQLEAMLAAVERPDELLDLPPLVGVGSMNCASPMEAPGSRIGRYKLLEQIGEGGMGLVFMAEQKEPVRRKVALKLIKPGMDSKQVIARFEAERQALAMMDHPHIAKVLEGGTTDAGRPYFVMELVEGIAITDYCDRAQFTIRERLELFVQVCRAVQHAHTKGIIHRDLKPGNVLVTSDDGVPVPKIIDFGVAKALGPSLTEHTMHTAFSQMIGTPLYMSPEQAEFNQAGVDTRSDVYSLGVLLYELLTGTTPIDRERLRQSGFEEFVRLVREEESRRPSVQVSTLGAKLVTVSRQRRVEPKVLHETLHGELDWIVLKALEKDRTRRYQSASALAADVQRSLDDEPVEACPPTRAYRFRKFARKNRRLLATAGIVFVALLAATAVSAWQAAVARTAQHNAEKAERQAAAISEFLQKDLLQQVSPDHLKRDGGFPTDSNLTVLEALHRASANIGNRFQNEPLVEAAIRNTIGRAYRALGDEKRASIHFERATELLKVHLGPDHPETLKTQVHLAFSYNFSGRRLEAIALMEYVAERQRATLGTDDKATLFTTNSLGETYRNAGMLDKAAGLIEPILEKRRKMYGLDYVPTINSMRDLGCVYRDMGRYAEAIALLEKASERLDTLIGGDHVDTLLCIGDLALALEQVGRLEDADRRLRDIIARIGDEKLRQTQGAYQQRVLLGKKMLDRKKLSEAEFTIRECAMYFEKYRAASPYRFAALSLLGEILLQENMPGEAEAPLRQAHAGLIPNKLPSELKSFPHETAQRLVRVYEATNQPEQANVWRAKIETRDVPKVADRP